MASEKVQTFTDGNFDEVTKSGVVLVDFWAEWCGPCRRLAPTVDALASDFDGKVTVGKLNVDENPAVAATFGVRSIPTLIVLRGGKVVDQQIGALPQPRIAEMLERQLAPSGAGAREA